MFNKKLSDISMGKFVVISIITILIGIWLYGWFTNMAAKRKLAAAGTTDASTDKVKTTGVGPNNKPTLAYR